MYDFALQEHDEVWRVSKSRLQHWPRLEEQHIHEAPAVALFFFLPCSCVSFGMVSGELQFKAATVLQSS